MTQNKARKSAIRARMAKTGEPYTLAARHLTPCVFCGSTGQPADDEHVIPRWARRAFDIQGPVTIEAKQHPDPTPVHVERIHHLNIVLRDAICRPCNSIWLAGTEKKAAQILKPMAVDAKPAVLHEVAQALIAFWAVKTALLLELAISQQHPDHRPVKGYQATPQELAWIRERGEPPPRSMVWLGCWNCEQAVPVNYEPSAADLPTADGHPLAGHLTTFTLGFVAFQVFTVDYIAADQHGAPVWNTRPPVPLRDALPRIWPPQLVVPDIKWPPRAFDKHDWHRLVTWDGVLRPSEQPNPAT
jgi:hypothetical protein